ncbi:H/ACA ribonucleoprotein complex non-core subunit NAF1-like isoform X2 [Salvia hispanica]|uniref:H/ACA ribonucleoprotein complex non-core subunit NAF1-like isoform X2 n=1 Tax=Salvia hispanica TaxID=49212 RepID=UPI002008FF88|nr:H/ACA ribonucleoprotein complex non-core subunit NAF1-like isoform X2 [Salvia hispanica]XP_047971679.1 H/ACA ribonucleoprotein complex non-core subunit NAF1-like isoform X2 [Salvia hispanica]
MVGFLHSPAVEGARAEENEDVTKRATDLLVPELDDIPSSFSDSFLDFEALNGWFTEGPGADMADLRDEICREGVKVEPLSGLGLEDGEIGGVVEKCVVKGSEGVEGDGCERKLGDLGCLIEEQLGKVSLDGAVENLSVPVVASLKCENSGSEEAAVDDKLKSVKMGIGSCGSVKSDGDVLGVGGDENKVDESVDDGDGSGSTSDSSSSSSSSSEDKDDGKKKDKNGESSGDEETEMEDGEIVMSELEEMVSWSDVDDEDGGGGGPIKSKNELEDLPPVPSVNVTLEPRHETLPVGTVLSMIGAQVIVEGVEKHDPLNEGSILWITESRSPLGIIDEIFGPVKNPFYIVRYNSEEEVPTGIQQGTLISFVAEFADHVLNNNNLYQKGYDASNENDEELSEDGEFSDDEKEAEYRRMMKMKKRGTNDSKPNNKRKEKRQQKNQRGNGSWNNNNSTAQTPPGGEGQRFAPRVGTPSNQDSHHQGSLGSRQGSVGDQCVIPPSFPHRPQAQAFPPPNGSWNNGFPQHQQLNANLLAGLPPNGMLWMQQQNLPYLYPTGAPFQQQISMIPGMPPNFNPMAGLPNIGGIIPPWPMDQNASQFGMQGQQGPPRPQFGAQGQQGPQQPQFTAQGQQGPPQPQFAAPGQQVPPQPQFGVQGQQGPPRPQFAAQGQQGPPQPQFGVQGQQGPPRPQFGVEGQQGPPPLPLNGAGEQAVQTQVSPDGQPQPPAMSFNGSRGGGRRGGRRGGRGNHRGRGRYGGGRHS